MQIVVENNQGTAILKISGRMDFDESLFLLRRNVQKLIESGTRRFVFDLSDVPYLDSSGCGELISAHASIVKAQGLLVVLKPQQRVRLLLERIRLHDVFKIADSMEAAQAAL